MKLLIKQIAEFDPENIGKDYPFKTIEYIDTGSVIEGNLLDTQKLSLTDAPSRAKRIVRKNDVLISLVRPNLKHFFFAKQVSDNTIASTGFVVIRTIKANPRYLYYFLTTPYFTEYLSAVAESHTSAYPAFPSEIIENYEIELPSDNVQRSIAKILGDLDDQTEYLIKQNKILEKIIQSVFKSWFVDFNGQTEFVDSELGEIPKGWNIGNLGNIANNIKRQTNPQLLEKNRPYVGLEHMPRGSIALSNWGINEGLLSNKFEFSEGDILFGKLRPYFKKVVFAPCDGICSTDILVLNSKSSDWFSYLLCIVASENFISYTNMGSTGTRMPRTDWNIMSQYSIILPPEKMIKRFNDFVRKIIDLIKSNTMELHILSEIRDSLLPKLMSGEISHQII